MASPWLDSDYCGCFVAIEMANEGWRRELFFVCVPQIQKDSLMKGSSQCPLFLLWFMNISGDERNKAWGSSRWKNSHHISRGANTENLTHTLTLWSTQAKHRSRYTKDFQFAIRPSVVNSPCSPPLSPVFGIKVPPSHKSQILYDTVEIALSKMQSAKAASSADELLWLRERQWLVSFAPIGSAESRACTRGSWRSHNTGLHPPSLRGSTLVHVQFAVHE